jgi:hypothetical protein
MLPVADGSGDPKPGIDDHQAARRLPRTPTVLTVHRSSQSEVIVRADLGAVDRHLEDAHALRADPKISNDVKRMILPGVLRQAVEASLWERYSADQLRAGRGIEAVEADWERRSGHALDSSLP